MRYLPENVVNEQEHILALVPELLSNSKTSDCKSS